MTAPTPFGRRVRQLAAAGVALIVSAGWWVAAVQLTPAADRPYIGGSQDNSLLNLIFGYNGFGRLSGNESGSVGGTGAGGSVWGPTGWNRLFLQDFGGQVAWLIPGALVLGAAVLWMTRRAPRTDRTRAALVLWSGILLVTGATFSFAKGIIHPYYTVALAPAIGGLVGIGAVTLWKQRQNLVARLALSFALAATAVWSFVLLDRTPQWLPELRWSILVVGLPAALALGMADRLHGRSAFALGAAALVAALAGAAAYTLDTVVVPHSGAIPSAGPTLTGGARRLRWRSARGSGHLRSRPCRPGPVQAPGAAHPPARAPAVRVQAPEGPPAVSAAAPPAPAAFGRGPAPPGSARPPAAS